MLRTLVVAALVAAGTPAHAQPPTTAATPTAEATAAPPAEPAPRPMTDTEVMGLVVLGAAAALVTFAPAALALLRGHRSTLAIFAVCLFFGWTCVGWVVALIWSLADTGRRR
jgi:hypothetical protein